MAAKERRNCMRGTEASVVEAILTLLEEGSHYGTDAQHKLYRLSEDGAVTNAARPESLQRYERQARRSAGRGQSLTLWQWRQRRTSELPTHQAPGSVSRR